MSSIKSILTPKFKSKSPRIPVKPEDYTSNSEAKLQYDKDNEEFKTQDKIYINKKKEEQELKKILKKFLENKRSKSTSKGGRSRNRKSRRSKNKKQNSI